MQRACRWIEIDDNAYLHWHYMCIATVKRQGLLYVTSIDWLDCTHTAQAASLGQGVRLFERWVSNRNGFPRVGVWICASSVRTHAGHAIFLRRNNTRAKINDS